MAPSEDVAQTNEADQGARESMGAKVGDFLKKNLTKGELALKHAAGLGSQPNVVPVTEPSLDGEPRPVEVGWHPVGGLAGKWFAEQTGLGKMITDKINKYPDPTQHWAVLVGDYAHQLWMDENFDVIYTNEKIKREEWRTFQVGETRFNDDATRRAGEQSTLSFSISTLGTIHDAHANWVAGESVIQSIRERQPAYNLITNNCQTYALQLLDAIKVGSNKQFGTTLAVYERLKGPGNVMDLFVEPEGPEARPEDGTTLHEGTVSFANQVMHDNTTQLDAREEMERGNEHVADENVVEDERTDRGDCEGQQGSRAQRRGKRRHILHLDELTEAPRLHLQATAYDACLPDLSIDLILAQLTPSANNFSKLESFASFLRSISPIMSSKETKARPKPRDKSKDGDKSKVHKLSLKGSARLVAEFFQYSIHTILFQRGVYPAEDFSAVKKYGLNMLVSSDDQVKAYIKKIMSQLDKWMVGGKISKLVIVITDKDTGEHVERWQFDVQISQSVSKAKSKSSDSNGQDQENATVETPSSADPDKTEAEIQSEIAAIFRQITASVTFLPQLHGDCTFNVLVYADADSDVPVEWGDSDAKEIANGEHVQLRGFSTANHRVDTLVSYRLGD
ncbi:hypothetical protein E4U19_001817 [Claviceps sp. Clav32 group G5]|nr:hypothetical protein E4U19_001817 [Claviceps sp. Clav32 group G5]KAG6045635.1 hypothetical protein E4U39_002121 [Claviceps sp. Clav50 group G5]